ncbi:hypothetical protein NHQ30_002415 [Ciborinia camelliae]|nr:hypothetical protein NHQ30_002415 [Ciborinia camelliae]
MNYIYTYGILLLGAVQSVYCLPEALKIAEICPARLITTTYISTISAVQVVPYSCYTHTVATIQSSFPCSGTSSFNPATCGPVIQCIILSTTTRTVPPTDSCCKATPTVYVPGSCAACQKGCATDYTTVTVTADVAALPSNPGGPETPVTVPVSINPGGPETPVATLLSITPSVIKDPIIPCTSTLRKLKHFTLGPTKTLFPTTVTTTSTVNCAGCEVLSVELIGGVGPVVEFNATVKVDVPSTTTAFVCSQTF